MFSLRQNNDLNVKNVSPSSEITSVNGTDSECCSFSFHTLRINIIFLYI